MIIDKRESYVDAAAMRVEARPLLRLVYMWMGFGLLVTTVVSLLIANTPSLQESLLNQGVFFGAIIAELVVVIALGAAINKLSPGVAALMFFGYAALNGFTLSIVFLIYTTGSIVSAFTTTMILFGVMSVVGFTTQVDLSKYRTYFMMGLIGLVIAMVVNWLLRSDGLSLIISLFGVVLFTALTAYDTQKIMRYAANPQIDATGNLALKFSIMGALTLYLDFINLFLFMLRILSRDR